MKLSYNGYTFEGAPRPVDAGAKPQAINWRFGLQRRVENLDSTPRLIPPYAKPRWMNWKFELALNPNYY